MPNVDEVIPLCATECGQHRESTWAPALFFTFHSADRQFFQRPFVAGRGGGSERPSPPLPLPLVCVFIGVCALSVHRFFFFACKRRFLTASPPQSPTCVVAGRGDHRNNDRCLCHPRHQRRVQRGRPCACPVIKALFFLLLPCADSQPTHPGRSRQPSRPSSAACS